MGEGIDDADDKARRNVLAFSSAILLGAWLKVPFKAIADKVLSQGAADNVAPWRIWIAVLAVLVYLILRFRFSGDTRAAASDIRTEWGDVYRGKVNRLLRRHLARFSKSGRESSAFNNGLQLLAQRVTTEFGKHTETTVAQLGKISLIASQVAFETKAPDEVSKYRGTVSITYFWHPSGAASSGSAVPFEISGWTRWRLLGATLWTVAVYSTGSTRVVVPTALASVALATTLYSLARSLFTM